MRKTIKKTVSAVLVLLLIFSVMSSTVSAAELKIESDDAAVAEIGADAPVAEIGAAAPDVEVGADTPVAEIGADAPVVEIGADASEAEVGAAAPVITSVQSVYEGVRIEWQASDGINLYRVDKWYDDGRGWQKLTDTSELYYVDEAVRSGNTYKYRLYGVNADGGALTTTSVKSVTYSAPVRVNDAQTMSDGIRIYWNKEPGVSKVAVMRMENGNWKQIAVSSDSSYLDKNVSYGNEYRYTVKATSGEGSDVFDETGLSHKYLKTPTLQVDNAAGGVMLRWDAIEGAEAYRVFYRNSSGAWTRMAVTQDHYLLDEDVLSGYNFTYTVRCITADGERYTSYCDTTGKSIKYIAAPVLVSAKGTDDGISISWKASVGASKYRVFYKNANGQWARLADTSDTSYLDKNVRSGVAYTYTVRCMNSSGEYISSYYDEGISGMYLHAPEFSVSNGAEGVDISWAPVEGAEKYRVYYYGSKGWTRLVDTTETSFTDKDVVSGYNFTYTVRCINAAGTEFTSGYLPGKKVKYYAAPTISSLTGTEDGVRISWGAVSGVQKYRVYYHGRNGWTKLVDTANTSFVDKEVTSGGTYTYTVRCLNNAGDAFLSWYKPGVTITYIAAPDFKLSCNEKSITVSWDEVKGAELYRVYIRGANGWTKVTDTTATSYEDKNVSSGTTYSYTVRCLNKDATKATSDFYSDRSIKFVDTPRLTDVKSGPDGVEVSWNGSTGATKYRVYYKNGNDWIRAGETTSTTFVHTAAESGRDYTYTVRCINANGTQFESSFDPIGKTVHYIAAPKNLHAESYNNSIKISWTPSAGAVKYRVYYYGRNGWTKLTETTGSSVIDDDVASGYTYRYTVRCITADGKSFTSDFNHNGVSYKYTIMPVLYTPDYTKDGIEISWKSCPGAEKYRVYYYGSRGWTKLTETTGTSVEDTDVASGYTYRYTVRCITSDGRSFTSDCNTTGVKIYFVSAPKLVSSETESNRVTFTWNSPRGASKYRVYKRVNGSWRRLVDTSSNKYSDTDVSSGNTYTYTVRVINDAGTQFYSGFDPSGFVITAVSGVPGFYYYDQTQYSYPYGDDTIAGSGCGPTCFAMVASTLKDRRITPIDAVSWCGNSYYLMGVGTYWSYFSDAADHFGIDMEQQLGGYDTDSVIYALKRGKLVISAQSAGRFTRGGHFIVLAGITSNGRIIVYDPNGANHYVGTTFTMSEIAESGTQYWVFDN